MAGAADEELTEGDVVSKPASESTSDRFDVQCIQGRTVVSEVSSFGEQSIRLCILTRCITRHVFPYQKFILLDSELDFGGRLQKRICYKLNVLHDAKGYWESQREPVRVKLAKKRNNVTEAIRKKMEGK